MHPARSGSVVVPVETPVSVCTAFQHPSEFNGQQFVRWYVHKSMCRVHPRILEEVEHIQIHCQFLCPPTCKQTGQRTSPPFERESSSWLSWYRGILVSLTDCRWWFDSPLVREKSQDRRRAERQRARTKKNRARQKTNTKKIKIKQNRQKHKKNKNKNQHWKIQEEMKSETTNNL